MTDRRIWILAARLGVTAACVAALFAVVSPAALWAHLSRLTATSLAAALLLHAAIILLLAWRWRTILAALGTAVPLGRAIRATWLASFFNMVLPLAVGGDVWRVWDGRRAGIGVASGTAGALLDRLVGLVALALLALLAVLAVPAETLPPAVRIALMAFLPATLAALAALFALSAIGADATGWRRAVADLGETARRLARRPWTAAATLVQSLAAHLMAGAIAFAVARGLGVDLALGHAVLLFPPVLLATMLPVSIGGWGLREAAAIPLLALAGVPADAAVAIALAFGLAQAAASGAGAAVVVWRRAPARTE